MMVAKHYVIVKKKKLYKYNEFRRSSEVGHLLQKKWQLTPVIVFIVVVRHLKIEPNGDFYKLCQVIVKTACII